MKKINHYLYSTIITLCLLIPSISIAGGLSDQDILPAQSSIEYALGEVIVKFKESKSELNKTKENISLKLQTLSSKAESLGTEKDLEIIDTILSGNLVVFKTKKGESVEDLVEALKNDPDVEYAEPNYYQIPAAIDTNDTYKDYLWGLDNTGQDANGTIGIADADIDAPEAWAVSDLLTLSPVIVADIDNGVAYNHLDLVDSMWDGTNCLDENGQALGGCMHGYDYYQNDKLPLPGGTFSLLGHGTHIAGTIGAKKNNNLGIIGVTSNAKIMALSTDYLNSTIIKSIDFARENGAKIINASWGGSYNSLIEEAIKRFTDAGGLFITIAHNYSRNNDTTPLYPSSLNNDSIISVAATNQSDGLASFSDWGPTSVDVAAPGQNIYSTYCATDCTSGYLYMYGTSMAAPHVVGLASLIWGINPSLSAIGVKNIILSTGDSLASLSGKILTEKRINAYNAINQLNNLSSYIPVAGYAEDNIIPSNQITNTDGILTINFKVKDAYPNLTEQLSDFSYSIDGGANWLTPTGGDNSTTFSNKWNNNNYISKTDYSGSIYNFTFNSRSSEAVGLNNFIGDNIKIRFKVSNGINESGYVESGVFSLNNYSFDINIYQPSTTVSINADIFEIIGSTNAGSLVQIYNGSDIVGFTQLGIEESDFFITVSLAQNIANDLIIKVTEPIYNSEQEKIISTINEGDGYPYTLGWVTQTGAGLGRWRSIASSADGLKLVAVNGHIGWTGDGYIYTSNNGGYLWTKRENAGSYNWASVASSSDGMKLVAVVGGDYETGYIYTSINGGITWTPRTANGSLRWQSVASSSDGEKLIAVTGGRYHQGYIYVSSDYGVTWTKKSSVYDYWYSVASSSDGSRLIAVSGGQYNNGDVYISIDYGENWLKKSNAGLRGWMSVSSSSDGMKIIAANGGVWNGGYIYTSSDGGETWNEQNNSGIHYWYSVASSSDGLKLFAVAGGEWSNNEYIYSSSDGGLNWIQLGMIGNNWSSIISSSNGIKLVAGGNYNSYIYTYNNITTTSPSVITSTTTSITKTTATLNANITGTGGETPTTRGFHYGLTDTYGTTTTEEGTFSTGTFLSNIEGLACGTTYHFQSYATNTIGTGVSADATFTTSDCSIIIPDPVTPTSTSATINSKTEITLSWSSDPSNTEYYAENITKGTNSGWTTSTSYQSTGLTCNTNYSFQVKARNELNEESGYSDIITAKTNACGGGSGGGGSFSKTTPVVIPVVTPIVTLCSLGQLFNPVTGKSCTTYTNNTNTTTTPSQPLPFIKRTLKMLMYGEDVKQLQIYLNTHGYPIALTGYGSLGNETTKFGGLTKKAVIKFQLTNGLKGDGVVGPITLKNMKELKKEII